MNAMVHGKTQQQPLFILQLSRSALPELSNLIYEIYYIYIHGASLVAQVVRDPPTMYETWVRSLGGDDPLEEGMQYSCLENAMDSGKVAR